MSIAIVYTEGPFPGDTPTLRFVGTPEQAKNVACLCHLMDRQTHMVEELPRTVALLVPNDGFPPPTLNGLAESILWDSDDNYPTPSGPDVPMGEVRRKNHNHGTILAPPLKSEAGIPVNYKGPPNGGRVSPKGGVL